MGVLQQAEASVQHVHEIGHVDFLSAFSHQEQSVKRVHKIGRISFLLASKVLDFRLHVLDWVSLVRGKLPNGCIACIMLYP